ncbi:hypothetical protein AVEN_113947-1 [Araneus ventricosus]|uniref:Uncharacterized protein n=1 Tax=Araneus ventricosus TaxID=182803 RepID=A0A4Y2IVA4_ARAVE|nr:hypothetical protein AVEN_113947-1 [Araneus ventricosus]
MVASDTIVATNTSEVRDRSSETRLTPPIMDEKQISLDVEAMVRSLKCHQGDFILNPRPLHGIKAKMSERIYLRSLQSP